MFKLIRSSYVGIHINNIVVIDYDIVIFFVDFYESPEDDVS